MNEIGFDPPHEEEVTLEVEDIIKQIVEKRIQQPYSSRLAEYITGLRPDTEANIAKLVDRVTEDQQIIRQKYGLPPRDMRFEDPNEYERQLRKMAAKLDVSIREKSDCGDFFNEFSAGGAYNYELNIIGVSIDRSEVDEYSRSLAVLEHEYIHSVQNNQFPDMPIELAEYEAYAAGASVSFMKDNPDTVGSVFFGGMVGRSVDIWYTQENQHKNPDDSEIKPVWDDPKYFLREVSRLSEEQIEKAYSQLPPPPVEDFSQFTFDSVD